MSLGGTSAPQEEPLFLSVHRLILIITAQTISVINLIMSWCINRDDREAFVYFKSSWPILRNTWTKTTSLGFLFSRSVLALHQRQVEYPAGSLPQRERRRSFHLLHSVVHQAELQLPLFLAAEYRMQMGFCYRCCSLLFFHSQQPKPYYISTVWWDVARCCYWNICPAFRPTVDMFYSRGHFYYFNYRQIKRMQIRIFQGQNSFFF